jgi:hypothetical protein
MANTLEDTRSDLRRVNPYRVEVSDKEMYGIKTDTDGYMVLPVGSKSSARKGLSEAEMGEAMSLAKEYLGEIESAMYDFRFDDVNRKNPKFDAMTQIKLHELNGLVKKLGNSSGDGKWAFQLSGIQDRLRYSNIYSKAYDEMLNSDRIVRDGEKFSDYTTAMDMRSNCRVDVSNKVENRIRLRARLAALARLKELDDGDVTHKYGGNFRKFKLNNEGSRYDMVLRTMESELYELNDWDLIGSFQKIMGRRIRTPKVKAGSSAKLGSMSASRVSAVKVEPKKGFFGRIAGKAAAFAAGVAIGAAGMLGYQNYSAPKNVVAEAYAPAERAEVKSDYELSLERMIRDRASEMPERDYSELNLW